jgi:signal transduction histidine kinase
VLWFEHDLYDQLQLLDVLALAHGLGGSLESIVVDAFPGKPSFRGLGELTPDELETLWPTRREVTAQTLEEAAAAWDVFRARDPAGLAELAARGSEQLPLLAAALQRLLEELPDVADGLSRTERRALQVVADDARTPMGAFLATQELEEAPFLGDAWFYRSLSALGQGDERLLETLDGESLPPPPPLSDGQEYARLALRSASPPPVNASSKARRIESSCSASTAGSAAPTSPRRAAGVGTPRRGSSAWPVSVRCKLDVHSKP